jgi:hypothetical protein
MLLSDIFLGLGRENFDQLLRAISLGKLKTFQLFDRIKTRLHLGKLNQDNLRKCAPKLIARLEAKEEELALDLSQAVLISHLDLIVNVLNFLGVPHNDGFFEKDANVSGYLTENWQQRAFDNFHSQYPKAVLLFYLNHLAHEVDENSPLFLPAAVNAQ